MVVSVVLLIDMVGIPGVVTVQKKTRKMINITPINCLLTQSNIIWELHTFTIEVIRCTTYGMLVRDSRQHVVWCLVTMFKK